MGASEPPGATQHVQFEIRVVHDAQSRARVIVEGELDLLAAPQLAPVVERALADSGELLLDLSAVRFIDSAGLQAVLRAIEAARSRGRALKIGSSLQTQARRLFELTGVIDQLPLVEE